MTSVIQAVRVIETIFLDEFKAACRDKITRPNMLLDLHKYFRYQTKIYTFSTVAHIPKIYNEIRLGKMCGELVGTTKDISYPLTFLTELTQRMVLELVGDSTELEDKATPDDVIHTLATELAETFCLHTEEQDYISDAFYQDSFEKDEWVNVLVANPWLLVGALIRYTSTELTDNLYIALGEASDILRELEKQ